MRTLVKTVKINGLKVYNNWKSIYSIKMTESLQEQLAQWCFNLPYSNPTLKKNKTLSNKFN